MNKHTYESEFIGSFLSLKTYGEPENPMNESPDAHKDQPESIGLVGYGQETKKERKGHVILFGIFKMVYRSSKTYFKMNHRWNYFSVFSKSELMTNHRLFSPFTF